MRNQRGAVLTRFLSLIQHRKAITTISASPYKYVAGTTLNVCELTNRNRANTSPNNQHTNSCVAENLVAEDAGPLKVMALESAQLTLPTTGLTGVENLT
jgi:hypothetical protein